VRSGASDCSVIKALHIQSAAAGLGVAYGAAAGAAAMATMLHTDRSVEAVDSTLVKGISEGV
jgi:hypothetical protein